MFTVNTDRIAAPALFIEKVFIENLLRIRHYSSCWLSVLNKGPCCHAVYILMKESIINKILGIKMTMEGLPWWLGICLVMQGT